MTKTTVNLIPRAVESLDRLCESTGLSKTDVINRALQLYDYIDAEQSAGRDLLTRDKDGTTNILKVM